MLRIGVMLDSWTTSAWVEAVLQDIQNSSFAQVGLVILNTPVPPRRLTWLQRIQGYWKFGLFNRYQAWDARRHNTEPNARASRDVRGLLAGAKVLIVEPLRKGFTDRFSEKDLEAIHVENLDVIFRFGFRIIRGDILNCGRYGVWSFHHGDNREYRGAPPLFWEIYERNPVSGTVLQILTDSLDGGHVIYRGHSATDLLSLQSNRNAIYWKTAEFALRRLRQLYERGWDYIQSLETYNESEPYQRRIYKTPHAGQMAAFLSMVEMRKVKKKLHSVMNGTEVQWFIATRRRSPERRFDEASGYRIIRPPNDRFYADPLLIEKNGKTWLFLEDYRYADRRAVISCAEISVDGSIGEPIEVLRRPYHLSYPFLFEHCGEMYMIPETKQNQTVELYRAVSFPYQWVLERVLMESVFAVDCTLHEDSGKFWLFTGLSNGRYSNCDELALFFADSPFGPWKLHPQSPVVADVRRARPGGAIFRDNRQLIRPSQDCSKAYGYALCFSEITVLNEMEYQERLCGRIEPHWVKCNLGTHTYTRSRELEAIDGNFLKRGKG